MAKGYSKQVSDRTKASRALAQTIETNATAIVQGVKAALDAKGAKAPDVGPLLAALGSLVTVRSDALSAADQAHELEMADDQAPREARDAATEKGRETLIDLRAALAGTYGNASLSKVGLSGPAPQDPQALLAYGRKVQESLAQVKLGAPKRKGVQVDLKVFGKELDTQLGALESALKDVARETREGQATQGQGQGPRRERQGLSARRRPRRSPRPPRRARRGGRPRPPLGPQPRPPRRRRARAHPRPRAGLSGTKTRGFSSLWSKGLAARPELGRGALHGLRSRQFFENTRS